MTSTATTPSRTQRYGGQATTPVDRFVWFPVRVAPPEPADTALRGRCVLVMGGEPASRLLVESALRDAGARVVTCPLPEPGADIAAAAAAVVETAGGVDGIVDLGLEGRFEPAHHDRWKASLRQTAAVLQAVYDDWAQETAATRCFYLTVTWNGGRMGYDRQGIAQPLGGVWAGIAKSLPQELPNCRVKVLDLAAEDADDIGRLCTLEASAWDRYEVGYRAGVRYTLASRVAPPPAPRLELEPDDVVLFSGGGRGVGFAFARRLAAEVGCRVVVTGRHPVPDPAVDPWIALDDDAYADLRRSRLREAGRNIAEVRRENDRRDALRELARNLEIAAGEDLPLEYRVCDFLDAGAVESLVEGLGDAVRVVVHNAGIAAPTRLRGKSLDTVIRVVETKLVTFVNLVEALRDRPIEYFCNVGSVAGRMGGMAGQIDYAGANEVLSRLGFWAQQELGLPVATLCWTTWEQIGLIANYDAALRYGAALAVDEGVDRWLVELLGAEPTEAMFLGAIGTALSPGQIRGFQSFGEHPDMPWLLSRRHYLGEVEVFDGVPLDDVAGGRRRRRPSVRARVHRPGGGRAAGERRARVRDLGRRLGRSGGLADPAPAQPPRRPNRPCGPAPRRRERGPHQDRDGRAAGRGLGGGRRSAGRARRPDREGGARVRRPAARRSCAAAAPGRRAGLAGARRGRAGVAPPGLPVRALARGRRHSHR